MKYFLLLLVVLGVSSCFTPLEQYDILREEERTITRVIETNKTPDELFTLANFWVVRKFGSTEGFYSDKDAGILIGSARLYTPDAWTGLTFATYTIKIDLVSEDVVTLEIIAGEGYFNYLEIRQRVEPIDRRHWNYFIAEGLEQIATDFESNLK